tara:strand:- start:679 stop:873 length:195 start_codon:yes stop_codon:yes gene_type:complete
MEFWQIGLLIAFGAGFGYHMYRIGMRAGAEGMIDKLRELKVIAWDNKGNVRPNPFWEEHQKSKN